jgi:hypothetical protein
MHRKHDLNNERQNKEINIWKAKPIPSKSVKVFDAGLHGQKTLTKFLIENFDRVSGLYTLLNFVVD